MGESLCALVLLPAGCSSLTPAQRIAVCFNPAAHAADLAITGVSRWPSGLGPDITNDENWFRYPGHDCVDAINDKVREAESPKPTLSPESLTPPEAPRLNAEE